MTIEEFNQIESNISKYKYTSFKYIDFEDIKDYKILVFNEAYFIIFGHNTNIKKDELIYGCQTLDEFIHLSKDFMGSVVKFIDRSWYHKLIELGFIEYAVFRDYFLNEIGDRETSNDIYEAKTTDSLAISRITQSNIGLSRSFFGDDEFFVETWINQTNESLTFNNAKNPKIFIYKENEIIKGCIFTAILGENNPRGKSMWLREISVSPEEHNKGIGRKLINHALYYAKQDGAVRSSLLADDLNVSAIHLYQKLGYMPNLEGEEINMIVNKKELSSN